MKFLRSCATVGVTLSILAFGLVGCSSSATTSSQKQSVAIAATVNGSYQITEDEVTDYINSYRTYASLQDDSSWSSWLSTYSYTASDVRTIVIKYFAQNYLIGQAAADKGITVSDDTINAAIASDKSSFDSEQEWDDYLTQNGYTEDQYRDAVKLYYLEQYLEDTLSYTSPSDSDILSYASYYSGKKSSDIFCKWTVVSGDSATTEANKQAAYTRATNLISQLASGANFATLATANSDDTTAAASGGNVGWDCLNSFVTAYTTALDNLSVGQYTTTPVEDTTNYGYHIILCTEVFSPGDSTAVSDIPSEIYSSLYQGILSMNKSSALQSYVTTLANAADIQINDMPSGLSYSI
jgi:foldase protein PrsA